MIRTAAHRAFSLIELLIVISIIGILAAIAVPKFANASQGARENSLKEDLRLLRTQVGVYRSQHQEVAPGYPGGDLAQTPTAQLALDQLLKSSDVLGNTADTRSAAFPWGPYVALMPANPLNSLATLKILSPTDTFTPDGTTGWLYQPSTGIIKANVAGKDSVGIPVIDY